MNQLFRQNHSITLEQIKNFLSVYELESLSLAAAASHKTQPAISHSLSQLEHKLNTKLIQRSRGKTISFTEDGHQFYDKVSPLIGVLLTQLDEVENRKMISVGICDDLPIDLQMSLYSQINATKTHRVRLLCDFSYRVKEMVADGRLSFAIVKGLVDEETQTIGSRLTKVNSFHWVAHQSLHFDDEEKLAVVSAHAGCFVRDITEKVLNKANKNVYFSYISNHVGSQAEAIQAGFGVGVLDTRWIETYPEIVVLGEADGFPTLPCFKYVCIGKADSASKKQVQDILYAIVNALNG